MKYAPPYGAPGADDPYINGDPSIARQGSILPAAAAEHPQREIVNFIKSSNFSPIENDLEQLTKSARSQWVNFCIDTGSANAMSVALTPPLAEYKQGFPLRVLVKNNNTGATTINVNTLGNKPVTRANGGQLEPDDIRAGMIALLVDDGTRFQLVNFQGVLSSAINNYAIDIPYAADTGTVNAWIGLYAPPITTAQSGDLILLKVANKNTDAVMFTVNALAPVPVRRNDGLALLGGDIEQGEIILLVYNVSYWQVLRLVKSQTFQKLNANLTLYVRTDGNDTTGDGSANTSAKAFKTIQRAVLYVRDSFLIAGRTVTIQLGIPGTYPGQVFVSNIPGKLVIRGDPNNILSYNLQGPSGTPGKDQVFCCTGSGIDVTLQGVTCSLANANSNVVQCDYNASLTLDNIALSGVPGNYTGISTTTGNVIVFNYLHVYSQLYALFTAEIGGSITSGAWFTNIYTHGISYTGAFCVAANRSSISLYYGWINFTGTAYGLRFAGSLNSVIATYSGNVDFLPGNAPGYVDPSTVYG
jgi:hypothetical protein